MSGIGGILTFPGTAIDPRRAARLAHCLERRGRHRLVRQVDPAVTVVHAALRPSAAHRPEWLEHAGLWLAWDGRLDNSGELDRALGRTARHDLERVALAYERWGLDSLERLVGDFALAIWDSRQRRLQLARDAMGARPLFYAQGTGVFAWSSSLDGARTAAAVPDDLDEEWVAQYLLHTSDGVVTPYQNVRMVPPGQITTIVAGGKVSARVFWSLAPRPEIRLIDDRAYEERFAELFVESVRCRLTDSGTVAAELSGGLDSSSIVCVADHLIREGGVPARELLTTSRAYERSPSSDERRFVKIVEDARRQSGFWVMEDEGPAFADLERPDYEAPTALECVKLKERRVAAWLQSRGAHVLLSGFAGDSLVHSEGDGALALADHLWSGHGSAFARSLAPWRAAEGTPYPVLIAGAMALLTSAWTRRQMREGQAGTLACVDGGFARRMNLEDRLAARVEVARIRPSRRRQISSIRWALRAACWMSDPGPHAYEVAYPFLHRPLVEFCLAVPGEQFVRPCETRSLHRRALRRWLPAAIAARRGKRGPSEHMLRQIAGGWNRIAPLLDDAETVRRGFIDRTAFRRSLDTCRRGKLGENILFLMRVLALEAWLRARRSNRAAAASPEALAI